MPKKGIKEEKIVDIEEVIAKVPELDLDLYGFNVIESGVRKLVSVLWKCGYVTVCSCAGHLDSLRFSPWVAVLIDESNQQHLMRLFSVVGSFNLSLGKDDKLPKLNDTWVLLPLMTPGGLAVYIRPHSLNENGTQKELRRLRRVGIRLATFIEKEFLSRKSAKT